MRGVPRIVALISASVASIATSRWVPPDENIQQRVDVASRDTAVYTIRTIGLAAGTTIRVRLTFNVNELSDVQPLTDAGTLVPARAEIVIAHSSTKPTLDGLEAVRGVETEGIARPADVTVLNDAEATVFFASTVLDVSDAPIYLLALRRGSPGVVVGLQAAVSPPDSSESCTPELCGDLLIEDVTREIQ